MAAADQTCGWGPTRGLRRGTNSSGTGIALIGRASVGLGARLISSWVWVWRLDELVSRAGASACGRTWASIFWWSSCSWRRAIFSI